MKYTLAIETSCDDTSISILNGIDLISLKTFSQIKDHQKFGGVIPEVASRLHSKYIFLVIKEAIADANIELKDIDRIAVTGGPGMVNTLQVGITIAKTLSLILGVPLYNMDHIEAHAYSPFINQPIETIPNKAIILIASGGHTELVLKENWNLKVLGRTKDDSIGEAYDKVAKTFGYKYPGGAILDKIASETDAIEVEAPITRLKGYDFSYSGLKSFVLLKHKNKFKPEAIIKGFQNAAIKQLTLKVEKAVKEFNVKNVFVGGGVSANSLLRSELSKIEGVNLYLPKLKYTGDNAAMIGYLAVLKIQKKLISPANLKIDAEPRREL